MNDDNDGNSSRVTKATVDPDPDWCAVYDDYAYLVDLHGASSDVARAAFEEIHKLLMEDS